MQQARLPYLLIPVAAFIAIVPLLINGCSCGHDFDFHILSWFEAARQFTHGNLHPHWAYTPAWNAGEPRFVFYPPLSWTIGAILGLIFPWTWTPILYTWLSLTACGLALHRLARDFTTGTAALIAATLYTVNPYMLFTAYERTAYAELLAAAWIPLLLHAILRKQVTIPRIAIPITLLWLTNAPAAVMSCYALALLTIIRVATKPSKGFTHESSENRITTSPGAPYLDSEMGTSRARATASARDNITKTSPQTRLQLALNTTAGTALGLGLAAFYVLPAAYERRYVQIAMAIIPNMRIQDNFLFHHTGDIDHDQVLHTASLIAVVLIAATAVVLTTLCLTNKVRVPHPSRSHRDGWDEQASTSRALFIPFTILTLAITLLLTPLTQFIWTHAPELAFLQFPWRLVAILAPILALTIALALTSLNLKPTFTTVLAVILAAALTYPAYTLFRQSCDEEDTVEARLALFHSNKGTDPTDEYTPITADNDFLATTNPPYWFSPDPGGSASAVSPIYRCTENCDSANTKLGPAPTRLELTLTTPGYLILNLRDYPAWRITLNRIPITTRIRRHDGLIALPIPTGPSTITITYTRTLDQTLGNIITTISLIILIATVALGKRNIA
jgi:hypothetical protein